MQATACGNRFKPWFSEEQSIIYDHRYVFEEIGYNLKPLDLQAAMGLEQLKKLPSMEQARRDNFKSLKNIFEKYEEYFLLPETTPLSDPCWFAFMPLVRENKYFSKNTFVNFLENNKIQTRPYFTGNLLYHPAYRNIGLHKPYGSLKETFPNAYIATTSPFLIGTFIGVDEKKMSHIENTVDTFFNKLKL